MTFTSSALLSYLDYSPLTFTPGTPDSGEYLSTAAPKIAGNFTNLFASCGLAPRMLWSARQGQTYSLVGTNNSLTALGAGTKGTNGRGDYTSNLSRRTYAHYDTGTTAGANGGIRAGSSTDHGVRGSAAGVGGFILKHRVGLQTVPASSFRFFTGLAAGGVEPSASAEPSSYLNCFGMGKDSGDSTMSIIYNDGSGPCTKIALDTGTIPIVAGSLWEIVIACAPGPNQDIAYRVRAITGLDDEGNDTFGPALTGTVGSGTGINLPAADTALASLTLINNAANASNFVAAILSKTGVRL